MRTSLYDEVFLRNLFTTISELSKALDTIISEKTVKHWLNKMCLIAKKPAKKVLYSERIAHRKGKK